MPAWFVVLPDCPSSVPVAAALRGRATSVTTHPSGRPWLLCQSAEITTAMNGNTSIAVLGEHQLTATDLADLANRVTTLSDLDQPAGTWPGSVHLIASVAGEARVQGSLSGFRQVVHTRMNGVTVAANRADLLADLTGATLDEAKLATLLLEPGAPHPIGNEPVWGGIAAVPTGCYLALDRTGGHRPVRWWTPPEPTVPMADGAPALRAALTAAVEVRTRGHELVSTDLGGFDSTVLCCLAAGGPAKVAAYTLAQQDSAADDVLWAGRTAAALDNVTHYVVPAERVPLTDTVPDEPSAVPVDRAWLALVEQAAARGSRVHLTGFGGDQVLGGSVAHLHTLLRHSPRFALRAIRGYGALPTMRLLDNRSYRSWLGRAGKSLRAAPGAGHRFDWATPVRLPPWASQDAVSGVRDLIKRMVPEVEPLGHGHGQHQELAELVSLGRMTRHLGELTSRRGVRLATPYLDDRVLEVGLAVDAHERVTPWRYKPLAVAAMRGSVPDEILARQTKAVAARFAETDLRPLYEDSRLAELGVIDSAALPAASERPLEALLRTLSVELWLRRGPT